MEIKKENIQAAFNAADESGRKLLLALFPELNTESAQKPDNRPVTERIKTFDDAVEALGDNDELVKEFYHVVSIPLLKDLTAYIKLRIIVKALNEGWEPQFTENETRYYPWFWLYTENAIEEMDEDECASRSLISTGDYVTEYAGFAFAYSNNAPSITPAYFGSRLCLKNSELAAYCGRQFITIWADYHLIRKEN